MKHVALPAMAEVAHALLAALAEVAHAQLDNINLLQGGNSADYLAARIKAMMEP